MSQSSSRKHRYRTINWCQYNVELKARSSLAIWMDKTIFWFAVASGKRGCSPKLSATAIRFA